FITLTALIGLLWLAFSAYNVIKLGRQSSTLKAQIQSATAELEQLQGNIHAKNSELAVVNQQLRDAQKALHEVGDTLHDTKEVLKNVAAGDKDAKAQAQRVLPRVDAATKAVNESKALVSQRTKPPNVEVKTDSQAGFEVGGQVYRGKDGETINIQIHYSGQVS